MGHKVLDLHRWGDGRGEQLSAGLRQGSTSVCISLLLFLSLSPSLALSPSLHLSLPLPPSLSRPLSLSLSPVVYLTSALANTAVECSGLGGRALSGGTQASARV